MVSSVSTGYFPEAVSPDSMITQLVCSISHPLTFFVTVLKELTFLFQFDIMKL